MAISRETKRSVERLARLVIQEDDKPLDAQSLMGSGFRQGLIPAQLVGDENGNNPDLFLSGDEFRAFTQALDRLVLEPELEHLEPRDIDSGLWNFICEIFIKRHIFADDRKRSGRVQAFLQEIAQPHTTFEVAVLLENVRVESPLTVTGVRIEHWGPKEAKQWAILKSDMTDDFVDKTVAVVCVKAGKVDRAVDRARLSVDRALDALRVGFAGSSPVQIRDNAAMFRQSGMRLVKEDGGARSHRWSLGFRPLGTTLSVPLISRTVTYLEPVERLISNRRLNPKFKKRFVLALRWMAVAMMDTDYDEKVVHICTALESLLTDRSDRWKGELIALRALLLQLALDGRFEDTLSLLQLYGVRSRIVHGSDIGLCGEGQYRYLFGSTTRLIMRAVRLVDEKPIVTNFAAFRGVLESEELLETAINWFSGCGRDGQTTVDQAAKLLLRQRRQGLEATP